MGIASILSFGVNCNILTPSRRVKTAKPRTEALLKLYNSKTRKLKISNALGDVRVRAGCLIGVALDLGDIIANTLMLVEKVTHTFKESEHLMDLTLRGGEFIA